jgi:rsbT antagonist protein RsbS
MEMIPVLKIGPVLMVSIQKELYDSIAEQLQDTILYKIKETQASAVLIDITAMEMVDSFIARVLSETAKMARVMNAEVVLVGMRPAVTMTLVEMGLTMPGINTAINIEAGLRKLGYELHCINKMEDDTDTPDNQEGGDGEN